MSFCCQYFIRYKSSSIIYIYTSINYSYSRSILSRLAVFYLSWSWWYWITFIFCISVLFFICFLSICSYSNFWYFFRCLFTNPRYFIRIL
nr:MAG TPA: hypothetical protein [Crassvirales sp.]